MGDGGMMGTGQGAPITSTPPNKCSGASQRHKSNPWTARAQRARRDAQRWLCASFAAHKPRKGVGVSWARLKALGRCGTGETMTSGGELVCTVDADGKPQAPRRREHRCGYRLCQTCARKWAGRNASAIIERVQLLDDVDGRARFMSAALQTVDDAAAMEAEALQQPPSRHRGSVLRAARNAQTRALTRYRCAERWQPGQFLVVTLTQRATKTVASPGETSTQRQERLRAALALDLDRLSSRMRKLTTSPTWRAWACAWAMKIETTFTTPERRKARTTRPVVGDDDAENWHVHAHAIVWAEPMPQDELRALWESTRDDDEDEGGRGSVWIQRPRHGAVAEVAKYAAKPLDLARHGVDVGAAWISVMAGRRLLRLGGAFDGVDVLDDDGSETIEDNAPEPMTTDANEHPEPAAYDHPRQCRLRTTSGRWVYDDECTWQSGAFWEEAVRAWREHVFSTWPGRLPVDEYGPVWLEGERGQPVVIARQ